MPAKPSPVDSLLAVAKSNPWHLFSGDDIEAILGISHNAMSEMRADGAPFPAGKSRPEWIVDWLRANPKFTLKAR